MGGSFLADSSPITLLPSLPGNDTRSSHWRTMIKTTMIKTMIDVYPLLSMFCPIYFLCCRPYYVPLHLLFGSSDISYAISLTITRDIISLYVCLHAVERIGTPTASHASHMYKLFNRNTYVQHIAVLRGSFLGACLRKICKYQNGNERRSLQFATLQGLILNLSCIQCGLTL